MHFKQKPIFMKLWSEWQGAKYSRGICRIIMSKLHNRPLNELDASPKSKIIFNYD